MLVLEILAVISTLLAVGLIAVPKIHGLYVGCVAQTLWAIFGIIGGFYFMMSQNAVLFIINIFAILSWRKKGIGK